MKIIVLSDSHGAVSKMETAIELEKPDCIIFLGDRVADFLLICDNYPGIPLFVVAGNCDKTGCPTGFSEKIITEISGVRFYITHGHNEHVKTGYMNLIYKAFESEASIALFGHTHLSCKNRFSDLELLNPGSIGSGSYGIVILENDKQPETFVKSIY